MVGKNHEAIIDLIERDERALLKFLGFELPDDVSVVMERGLDLTEADPKQLLADGRIVIGKPPTFGLVLEVQTMTKKVWTEKQFKWPHYAIGLRSALRCPTATLVITIDRRIEKLAKKPIHIGPNSWWQAMVLGPSNLPRDLSVEFTRANPTLALLALMAHGRTFKSPETPAATFQGLWESELFQSLENVEQRIYYDRALQTLPLWIAKALSEDPMTQEYFNPIVLNYVEQGREEGLRSSVVLLLQARGYSPTKTDLERIENEHDRKTLEKWVKAAADLVPGTPFFDDH